MSRHRDVRALNYSEEYEGYDDVYGHSVEDDYCVSPSAEQFLFDRSKQQNIASFITEPDIIEDNEDSDEILTEIERAKLMSCMESIKNVIGDTVPESEIKKKIIQSNFNAEVALDSVLKESSPKNVIGPSTVNKNNLEPYPDATPTKSRSSSFVIPKLSFNKQGNAESINTSFVNDLEISTSNSPMRFSSLSGLTSNPVNCANSTIESITNPSVSFKSLADLTAHHLQKTNNLSGDVNFEEKSFSPKTNFVIPKLQIKNNNGNDLISTRLDLTTTKESKSDTSSDRKIDDSIDLLEKSLSNVLAFSRNYKDSDFKNNSQNVEMKEDSMLSGIRTPSPDIWMIDLSSALKEVASLDPNNCSHTNSKVLEDVNNDILNSSLHASDKDIEIPYAMLPTTLNLSSLRYVKLPHTKNKSLFGRTLCRTWKSIKPVLKTQKQHYKTVKKFDFSIPYSRT